MKINKPIIPLIVVFLLFITHLSSFALNPVEINSTISLNPQIQNSIDNIPSKTDDSISGYIPNPGEIYASPSQGISLFSAEIIPANYDLRTYNFASLIRNQGNDGVCWSFASTASLESRMLMSNSTYDYSEAHMAYALSKYTDTPGKYNLWGFERTVNDGGNFSMAMAYYARGSGPVLESNDPYTNLSAERTLSITNSKPVDRYMTDMYILPDNEDAAVHRDKIKKMVMSYGAVNMAFYSSDTYYNSSRTAYYYPGNTTASPNHAVAIIGWNDNYSSTNFNSSNVPAGNGAFLIKNSWGNYNSLGGYFWMSYYDKYAGLQAGCIAKSRDVGYDNIHQYDPFGYTNSYSLGTLPYSLIANQYDATPGEILKAVSFNTVMENMSYEVYINKNSGKTTSDLNFIFSSDPVASGVLSHAGYHTIPLDTPLTLTGSDFSVVVYFVTNSGNGSSTAKTPFESNYSGYLTQATQNTGEGYIYYNSTWNDAATVLNASLCIKALTDNPPIVDNLNYTVSYTNADNTLLQTIKPGTIKAKFEVTNNTAIPINLEGIAALYKDNVMRDIKIADMQNLSSTSSAELTFNVPSDGSYYIKGFLMDKNNMPMPIIKTYSVLDSGNSITNRHYSKNTITLKVSQTSSLNLLGVAGGFSCDLTHRYTWTSGNSSIAEVTPSGRIIGISAGETYIKSNDDSISKLRVIVTN